jgi:hypothetical protein
MPTVRGRLRLTGTTHWGPSSRQGLILLCQGCIRLEQYTQARQLLRLDPASTLLGYPKHGICIYHGQCVWCSQSCRLCVTDTITELDTERTQNCASHSFDNQATSQQLASNLRANIATVARARYINNPRQNWHCDTHAGKAAATVGDHA